MERKDLLSGRNSAITDYASAENINLEMTTMNQANKNQLQRGSSFRLNQTAAGMRASSSFRIPPSDDKEQQSVDIEEHKMELSAVWSKLNTSQNGLSASEAEMRLKRDGPNALTPPKEVPEIIKFLMHILSGFALLLWVGSILCFIVYGIDGSQDNLWLGIVLASVVTLTGIFSYYQEAKSSRVMEGFKNLTPTMSVAIRDGKDVDVLASTLVIGDIVRLEGGNKVPADVRILECSGLKVNNSSLTGEPEPLSRSTTCSDDSPWETKNIAFFSTDIVEGSGTGIVIRCGDHTVIGQIATATTQEKRPPTLMKLEIDNFIKIITVIAGSIGVVFFVIALLYNYTFLQAVIFMIGIIVANVPEGLLMTVTVALTITAKNMASKNVLVKNVETVETLGSVTTVASDKTGTLTQNRMSVYHLMYDHVMYAADPLLSEGKYDQSHPTFNSLHRCAALCNTSKFKIPKESNTIAIDMVPVNDRVVDGNPSEAALLKFSEPMRKVSEQREQNPQLAKVPFNSTNKWMMTLHQVEGTQKVVCLIKGAPERIMTMCSHIMKQGQNEIMTEEDRQKCDEGNFKLASNGERVLAFAQMELDESMYPSTYAFDADEGNFPLPVMTDVDGVFQPLEGLTFLGLVSLMDPPREEVPPAVHACHEAGIKVVMVTGDHPVTARAIAQNVGIISLPTKEEVAKSRGMSVSELPHNCADVDAMVIAGPQINDFTQDDWDYALSRKQLVFARTLPSQKQLIVQQMQKRGQVVAVTGDGVNDSPALKTADVGIAMGKAGSEVAKDAADMILMDDNFASIVKGIEEGRLIFDNLKKSIAYTLSSNIPEITPFLALICLKIPLPLETVMILCIDLGTDLLPALSLAYEKAESDIMLRPPRDKFKDRLVTKQLIGFAYGQIGMIQAICGFFCYYMTFYDYGAYGSYLFGTASDWMDENVQCVEVSDTECWDYEYRTKIHRKAQTAFLVSIVIVQWADVIICKTRINSVFRQKMVNHVLNIGLIEETLLALLLVYLPGFNTAFKTQSIEVHHWLYAFPFAALIFIYDEVRKYFLRQNPNGWLYRYTYY